MSIHSLSLLASAPMPAETLFKKQKSFGFVTTPFQPKHELMYDVKPCNHDPGGVVLGVRCRFYVAFGREKKVSQSL